jgi:glycosyltransferase involved in cell wall biosynthesis
MKIVEPVDTRVQVRKILYVSTFGNFVGGGEVSLLGVLQNLRRDAFAPHLACGEHGAFADAARALEIPVYQIPMPSIRFHKPFVPLKAIRSLKRCMIENKIDLVHANSSRGALLGGLAAKYLGIPVIWHVRVAGKDALLDGLLIRLASEVIVNSQGTAKRFANRGASNKIRVVYNGVDTDRFSPSENRESLRKSLGFGPEEVVILMVGRLTREKGHQVLIDAAAQIRNGRCRYVIAGEESPVPDGPFTRMLRDKAESIGLGESFRFVGFQDRPEIWFQAADMVVVPSLTLTGAFSFREGFGRVAAEAGACCAPVVASRDGGLVEVVVDGETGLLVRQDDPAALASAIERLAADPSLRKDMGQRARAYVRQMFDVHNHVRTLESIYREILQT